MPLQKLLQLIGKKGGEALLRLHFEKLARVVNNTLWMDAYRGKVAHDGCLHFCSGRVTFLKGEAGAVVGFCDKERKEKREQEDFERRDSPLFCRHGRRSE